ARGGQPRGEKIERVRAPRVPVDQTAFRVSPVAPPPVQAVRPRRRMVTNDTWRRTRPMRDLKLPAKWIQRPFSPRVRLRVQVPVKPQQHVPPATSSANPQDWSV